MCDLWQTPDNSHCLYTDLVRSAMPKSCKHRDFNARTMGGGGVTWLQGLVGELVWAEAGEQLADDG